PNRETWAATPFDLGVRQGDRLPQRGPRSSIVSRMRGGVGRATGGRRERLARRVEAPPAPRAMPDRMAAVQVAADGHAHAGAGSTAGLLGQLQHEVVEHDDVVPADRALLDVAE